MDKPGLGFDSGKLVDELTEVDNIHPRVSRPKSRLDVMRDQSIGVSPAVIFES
jgi:hypothetical protein